MERTRLMRIILTFGQLYFHILTALTVKWEWLRKKVQPRDLQRRTATAIRRCPQYAGPYDEAMQGMKHTSYHPPSMILLIKLYAG